MTSRSPGAMIHEIPQESIRRLGSTQVITDPIIVIKELVENALDAGATSIIIEASPDLVSHIQVKDNGCGISPSDRNLMAKPHCTSKISTFDDLLDVNTLGFRGEALASLANVSGVLTITTRVKDEALAVACEMSSDGSLKTISPVSAPTGCTIKVTDLFAKFPVRKSTLEKTATKYLGQIKSLLLSYYLTHPQTRLQFKCVPPPQNRGKKKIETKYDIIFAASGTKEQAVIKAFGAESSRHGQWIERKDENDDVRVEAFVVKPDADTNPAAKKGVCIAYKNRPLSITRSRGLAHSIYSLYKKQIKSVFAARSVDAPTEPFLFLNILSSAGKVDVNIEPAKDDVLFESNDRVMSHIKIYFERVYGTAEDIERAEKVGSDFNSEATNGSMVPSEVPMNQTPRNPLTPIPEAIRAEERLLSKNGNRVVPSSPPIKISSSAVNAENEAILRQDQNTSEEEEEEEPETEDTAQLAGRVPHNRSDSIKQKDLWSFSMYGSGIDEDEDEDFVDIEDTLQQKEVRRAAREEDTRGDTSISNPWTISKLNSRVSQHQKHAHVPPVASTTRSPTTSIPPSPTSRGRSQEQSPRIAARPCEVPIIDRPTPGAPIARMSGGKDPWYPKCGSDNNMSSPNRRQGRRTPRQSSETQDASSSPPMTQGRSRVVPGAPKSTRKSTSAGPMDTWVGLGQAASASHALPSTEDEDEGEEDIRLPISVFFGTPDLGTSSRIGDGGRGIFPSASDRMRRGRRGQNPQTDGEDEEEAEEISSSPSFSEDDDQPIQAKVVPSSKTSLSVPKLSKSTNRSKPPKLPNPPCFFNKPFKPPSKIPSHLKDKNGDRDSSKIKLLVTTLPKSDLRSLQSRARLVEDSFYDDEYEAIEPLNDLELKKTFLRFLKKHVAGKDYSDDTELELLQEDILNGKEVDVNFRNLGGYEI
ncbi:hypothetical protein TWF730_004683 [Orbilia blumenaviensis]|uniref:DNA mismatch repair protein S5 domain-containing protein n=1 Tax=Orbilia blumenaviensis TaxID=1796055 RepID=A0AAV9TWQ7_9PEZI